MSFVLNLVQSVRENSDLLEDLCRFSENLLSEKFIRQKYHTILDTDDWERLGSDDSLVQLIESRKLERIRNGSLKKEKAAAHLVRGPDALAAIMDNPGSNARHVVDAVKTLDALATLESRFAEQQNVVVVKIDLGADVRARGEVPGPGDVLEFTAPVRSDNVIDAKPNTNIDDDPPVRRSRGRPPGSRNRKTIAAEQQLPFSADEEGNDENAI
jgi:hypothetical protein